MANLKKHIFGDKVKWILTLVVGLALIGAVIGLFVKLDRQTSTTSVGGEAYSIGAISATGEVSETDASIYMRKGVTVKGLKCEVAKDAKIKYQLFYYDKDGKFVSASEELTADFNGTGIPETAETVKVVITPTDDADGKVTLTEVLGYANRLTVTVKR